MKRKLVTLATILALLVPITLPQSYAGTSTQTKVTQKKETETQKKERIKKEKELAIKQSQTLTMCMDGLTKLDSIVVSLFVDGEIGYGSMTKLTDLSFTITTYMLEARDYIDAKQKPLPSKQFEELVGLYKSLNDVVIDLIE